MKVVQARPGWQIERFCAELIVAAYMTNEAVLGQFNEHKLFAKPGLIRDDLILQWELSRARIEQRK